MQWCCMGNGNGVVMTQCCPHIYDERPKPEYADSNWEIDY